MSRNASVTSQLIDGRVGRGGPRREPGVVVYDAIPVEVSLQGSVRGYCRWSLRPTCESL
jgi:hypothetical protein